MKDEHEPRLFADDEAVRHIGEGLVACTLTRPEWTHEAHLAACLYIVAERPDNLPERDLPGIIRRFNESVGGVNSDSEGYHETITQCFIRAVRLFLARTDPAPRAQAACKPTSGSSPPPWPRPKRGRSSEAPR